MSLGGVVLATGVVAVAAQAAAQQVWFANQTPAESQAGVTPTVIYYPENYTQRYGATNNADNTTAIQNAMLVAAKNGMQVLGGGLTNVYPAGSTGFTYDYALFGIDWQNGTHDWQAVTGGGNGFLFDTTSSQYTHSWRNGGMRNFRCIGPGSGSTFNALKFGSTTAGHFGAFASVYNCKIVNFQYGLTWGNNSWNQVIDTVHTNGCLWGALYPAGLSNSGENIMISHANFSNNTNGVSCAGGTLNIAQCSVDYNTNQDLVCSSGGQIRGVQLHNEFGGSGLGDSALRLQVTGSGSFISFTQTTSLLNPSSVKTSFAYGDATNTGACAIHLGKWTCSGFTETTYPGFNYMIAGHGTCDTYETVDSASPPPVPFSSANLLTDAGFENAKVYDWLASGNGAQSATSTLQHWAGTQSLLLQPSAGTNVIETLQADVIPGTQVFMALRAIFTGTATTDHLLIGVQFYDENGAAIGSNALTRDISTMPSVWTPYRVVPFGVAPIGSRSVQFSFAKCAAAFGNSDGNGSLFIDDCYIAGVGGMLKLPAPQAYPPNILSNLSTAFTFRIAKGMAIDSITVINSTGNAVTGGLKLGTTSGAADVFTGLAGTANSTTPIPFTGVASTGLAKNYQVSTGRQSYFGDAVTAWNSANVTVVIFLKRVLTLGY